MLFNSINYIFLFLPIVLAGYYLLAFSPWYGLRRPFLIVSTCAFYAIGGPQYLGLLLASVLLNGIAGVAIGRLTQSARAKSALVALAVIGNLFVLGYFKYAVFLVEALESLFAAGFEIERIILPLGISFFTFQQIGYLVDVSRGRIKSAGMLDYASFTLFFPQLLAGPIVQFGEVIEQHRARPQLGVVGRNILIGLALFAIGLFKKTVIADTLALYSIPVFTAAREGAVVGFVDTWLAAFAYTAQVYFDFSGYSDMAIGTARMFGIVLPLNFLSPLRSQSVVEIWRRWHATLGRWVQIHVFQPISLISARTAAQKGMGKYGTLTLAVIVPTVVSMLIIGVWHGAGWTFVIFGLLQGFYMSVNELWAAYRKKPRKARRKSAGGPPAWHGPAARSATLIAFAFAILPFGASGLADTLALTGAAFGQSAFLVGHSDWPLGLGAAVACVAAAYAIVVVLPNSHEVLTNFEPVLEWSERWSQMAPSPVQLHWRMTAAWSLVTGLILFLGVAFIKRGTTQFIYLDF